MKKIPLISKLEKKHLILKNYISNNDLLHDRFTHTQIKNDIIGKMDNSPPYSSDGILYDFVTTYNHITGGKEISLPVYVARKK